MILQALVRRYETLAARGEIARPGYAAVRVSYALRIDWEGRLQSVMPLLREEQRGKKTVQVPRVMEVPEPVVRTVGIASNFLCDHSAYLLGFDNKGKPERALRCFDAARQRHEAVLGASDSPAARAVLAFFASWRPEQAAEHPAIQPVMAELMSGANLVFSLPDLRFAHDVPEIRAAWDAAYYDGQAGRRMQCLVTGKPDQPIALLHGKIKGVRDAQSSGASIVSFNARSFESYGYDEAQGLNAPVGEYAAFAYTAALNALLADAAHRCYLGDATVVYWSEDGNTAYQDMFTAVLVDSGSEQNMLDALMKRAEKALPVETEGIEWRMPFYVLALSPNAARISVRFFWRAEFGEIVANIARHYRRMDIVKAPYEREYLTVAALLDETVNPNAREKKAVQILAGAVLRAVLMDQPYPEMLVLAAMLRIRAEQRVTRGRAAILKAWLLRNRHTKELEEVLTVALNKDTDNKPYVLGRLFAVMEKAQIESRREKGAKGNDDGPTIRNSYFNSACATPGAVFPYLLKLAQHHISKAEYGHVYAREIGELTDRLEADQQPFPPRLSQEEQGLFILGYYQQVQARYEKKNAANAAEEVKENV